MRQFILFALLLFTASSLCLATPIYTPGTASVIFSLVSPGGSEAPKHVLAVWITDAANNFIKTVQLQAKTRIGYLYQWNASRFMEDRVDGVSTATVNSYVNPVTVNWNGTDYNGNVLADGIYRFHIEFTDHNGAGPYTPDSYLQFTKGPTAVSLNPANLQYFTGLHVSFTPAVTYKAGDANKDMKVDGIDLAALGQSWDPLGTAGTHTWLQGDFDGNGKIDGVDLAVLSQNWAPLGYTGGTVPEPITLSLLAAAGLATLRRRK